MEVILDCGRLARRDSAHLYLKEQFSFPAWYGCNLDALYDCLTELDCCRIVLHSPAALAEGDEWGSALLETLQDAARDNPRLELVLRL